MEKSIDPRNLVLASCISLELNSFHSIVEQRKFNTFIHQTLCLKVQRKKREQIIDQLTVI